MTLQEIVCRLPQAGLSGSGAIEITALALSSQDAGPGAIFAAMRGAATDGHRFIPEAWQRGVSAVLAETPRPADLDPSLAWVRVPDTRAAAASIASALAGDPWRTMALVGVTGTNGKTTSAFLIHHIMKSAWHRAGLIGTICVDDGESVTAASHTTPDPVGLAALLARMRDHGCRGVAMEVSSHGIDQKRVHALGFDACVFTNLTQDHLDYHGTLDAYFDAKASWFRELAADGRGKKPVAVINTDDARGAALAAELDGRMPVLRFGFNVHNDFRALQFRQNARGMEFGLAAKGREFLVRAPLIGRFNVHNLLGSLAATSACGISLRDAVAAVADAPQVPGRMENVGNAGGATVFVDYAHTPDALENACRTLRELDPRRLITVFGCGGDRDRGKRPLMAAAAAVHSDACVITSDNPRSEDPLAIIREIEAGIGGARHACIADRAEAIARAVAESRSGDIILIAGKGHETTQQFDDRTIEFDDRRHAAKALREKAQAIATQR